MNKFGCVLDVEQTHFAMDSHQISDIDVLFGDDSDSDANSTSALQPPMPSAALAAVRELSVGGGRGVFAEMALPSGCLVLSEVPVMAWSIDDDLTDPSTLLLAVHQVCTSPAALLATRQLHPMRLEDADVEEIETAEAILREDVASSICADSGLPILDVLRVLLVLQHNGFASGLYQNLSLFNHSCDPNCIKFAPSPSSLYASEIWTTRSVSADEELCICYCTPQETTSTEMRAFLKKHHRFECNCSSCSGPSAELDSAVSSLCDDYQTVVQRLEGEVKWGGTGDAKVDCRMFEKIIIEIDNKFEEFRVSIHTEVKKSADACTETNLNRIISRLVPYQKLVARFAKVGLNACVCCIQAIDKIQMGEIKAKILFGQRTLFKANHWTRQVNEIFRVPLIQFCAYMYALNSIQCLSSQLIYLNPSHSSLINSFADLSLSLDIAINCVSDEIALVIIQHIESLNESDALQCKISNLEGETPSSILRLFRTEFLKHENCLKQAYSTHQKYPECIRLHSFLRCADHTQAETTASSCFWGTRILDVVS